MEELVLILIIDGDLVKYKAFVAYSSDVIAKGFRSAAFLETFYYLLAQGAGRVLNKAAGSLSKESLLSFLETQFAEVDRGQGSVPKEVCFQIFHNVPYLRFSKDEVLVLAAYTGTNRKGVFGWKEFLPYAYVTLGSLFFVRYVGRRLTLAFSSFDSDRMEYVTTLPLRKLAERLLHVVKVVEREGESCLEFPSVDVYFEPKNEVVHRKEETDVEEMSFCTQVSLPVLGKLGVTETDCTLDVSVVSSSWKSKVYATIEVTKVHSPQLQSYPLPVQQVLCLPSVLSVDEDEARQFIHSALRSFCLDYSDDHYVTMSSLEDK